MKEFTSELESFPGNFSLPDPFLDRHMKAWWSKAIVPLKTTSKFDWERYEGEWAACISLITEYGVWNVEGVSIGDLQSDAVPSAVKAWVMGAIAVYVAPFLPRGLLLQLAGIT